VRVIELADALGGGGGKTPDYPSPGTNKRILVKY